MNTALLLVVLVAVAYAAAHIAFQWLGRHLLIVSGAEYLLLGILLGPSVSGLVSAESLRAFLPFMTLALGWMGAMVGMRLYLPGMVRLRGVFYRVAIVQSLVTLVGVTAAALLMFRGIFGVTADYALVPSLVLGAIATCSAQDAVQFIIQRLGRSSVVVRQMEVAVGMDSVIGIVTVGVVLCFNHVAAPTLPRSPTPVEWMVISAALGVIGGMLFHLFLGEERDPDRLFISLGGAIVFMTGAATFLQLSPILPGMLMGVILVNTSRNRREIEEALHRVERPLYFVLLLCGGALWSPGRSAWLIPVLGFLAARWFFKVAGARVAARFNGMLPVLGPNWGRALLGQGGIALAIGFNYLSENNAFFPNIVFTAAVASVLLTDAFSARLMRHAVDASPWQRTSGEAVVVRATEPVGPEPRIDAVERG
ncbi:MAG TPA: hypothetical protein VFS94_09335 [Gemmatimonadales bacterium]|nr:hypothetical protein [Gemmatimonadales bacterium]